MASQPVSSTTICNYKFDSYIRGYYAYKDRWNQPWIGEVLPLERDPTNPHDKFRTLEVNGINNFLVIEATDRIGGRIREYDGTGIEVGANWIHGLDLRDPKHHPIWREWVECDEDGPDGSVTPFTCSSVYNIMGKPYNISDMGGIY